MPSNCQNYQKNYIRKHYQLNKQYYKDKAKERTNRLRPTLIAFVNRYKLYVGCIDCSYRKHPHALHFDHTRDKRYEIGRMVQACLSLSTIKNEIRKCEVRCANCHAIKTAERRTHALSS